MKSRTLAFVMILIAAFAVIARGQEVQITGSHERVQTRVFVPLTSRVALGAQYGFENGRAGKHDAAALVRVDVLKVGRLTLSPEGGYGLTRTVTQNVWFTRGADQGCTRGCRGPVVDTRVRHESVTRGSMGTWVAGASARYRINKHLSVIGIYQRHGVNGFPQRNVWSAGLGVTW